MTLGRLLGVETLYSCKYGLALAADTFLVLAGASFVLVHFSKEAAWAGLLPLLAPVILVLGLFLLARFWLPFLVVRRLARRRRYRPGFGVASILWLKDSAAGIELNGVDGTGLIDSDDDWRLYDIVFNTYRRTRYGRYKSKENFYTVLEFRLRRAVPHLIFDSKLAKGRQFSRLYSQGQQLQLAPVFDEQFYSYAPKHYQIDTLSFITPEVLEAMLAMYGCDFEFLGSRLVCYAPLLPARELDSFRGQGLNLWRQVDDNLATYRDDRLDRGRGKQEVAKFGQRLLENPYQGMIITVALGLLWAGIVVLAIQRGDWRILVSQGSVLVFILFTALVASTIATKRKNRRLEDAFLAGQEPE